jgi:predicted ester cyclase
MPTDIVTTARRTLEEIFPRADVAALAEVVHPECINHELPPGMPQGLEGMRQVMLMLNRAFSDLRYDIHQVLVDGDTVAIHCTMRGRHTGELVGYLPTGRPIAVRQAHFVRFADGKGIEHWAVRDDLTMMRQLGLMPDTESERPVVATAVERSP